MIAASLAVPLGPIAAEESLEETSSVGPIPSAIDNGAASSLTGLLPTSEQYQRAQATIQGLKDGVPVAAPTLTTAQLDEIAALARGAVAGTLASPTSVTGDEQRDQIAAFAEGYLAGALSQLASSPTSGRSAVDEAVAKGVFAGAIAAILGPEALVSNDDLEAYARTLAAETFDELDANGALLASVAGSAALADITLFATTVSRAQLEALPTLVARAQLDAVATFGAGTLDGMVVGVVTGFPSGVPAPAEEDIKAWVEAFATGFEDAPPYDNAAGLPLLLAWADASTSAAVLAIDEARETVLGASPPTTLDAIAAWADGLAAGAIEHIDGLSGSPSGLIDDVRVYADSVTGPAIGHLVGPHPTLDPDAVSAYAEGLTGGVGDLQGETLEALGLSALILEGLQANVTDLPMAALPAQSAALEAYLDGATSHLTTRAGNITAIVGVAELPLLEAMVAGMAEGAIGLVTGPALSRPDLAEALGDGIASGFLDTHNPRVLAEEALALQAAALEWVGGTPPVSIGPINELVFGGGSPYYALQEFGQNVGKAPLNWTTETGQAANREAFGGAGDVLWLAEFTKQSAPIILDELKESIGSADPKANVDAVMQYAENVTGSLGDPDLQQAIANLTAQEYRGHAKAFAEFALTPLDWYAGEDERDAAVAVLKTTLNNTKDVKDFADPEYAQAAIAFLEAMEDGIKEGRPRPGAVVDELKGEGWLPAWAEGVTEAILGVPTDAVKDDISARITWLKTMTGGIGPMAKDATADQKAATKAFANETTAWALGAPDRVPPAGNVPLPLVSWAEATMNATLRSLPAVMTEEEQEAIVAYAAGVQKAVTSLPPVPTPGDWGALDEAALGAYVGGILSGIGVVQNETVIFLCAYDAYAGECPGDVEPPCDDPDGCETEPGPDPEPGCDLECEFNNYTAKLELWAGTIVEGGLLQMEKPDATPTETGVAFVTRWAAEVLAGHGACPDFDAPSFECDGPRGPVFDFVAARNDSVMAFANATSSGYASFIDLEDPPEGYVRPVTDPILEWAKGVGQASAIGFLQPERFLGDEDPSSPAGPPTDPADPEYLKNLEAWTDATLAAPEHAYDRFWTLLPDTDAWNATAADLDYLFGHTVWEGGFDAMTESGSNASTFVLSAIPNESLEALAGGLANATKDVLVDPAAQDLQQTLVWYQGLAEGGVQAIVDGAHTIEREQLPAVGAYVNYVATTFGPPPPSTEQFVAQLLPADEGDDDEGGSGGGGGGNEEPPGPAPEDVYLTNLQAHAQGIAAGVLEGPRQPFIENATAYGALYLQYLQAIADAAQALPPVSPDAGFPARLSAWTAAQTEAALAAPPTSPERVGPDPDAELALAMIEAFAGTSPWGLPPDAERKLDWANEAVAAGIAAGCPSADPEACAALGDIIGTALGQTLPGEAPPGVPADPALLLGLVQGAASGLTGAEPAPDAVALVSGLTAGLVPEGSGNPNADEVAAAVAGALGPAIGQIPLAWVQPAAEEMAATLLTADPDRIRALANGAAAMLISAAESGETDPAQMERSMEGFLKPDGSGGAPSVSVSDGTLTLSNGALDGSAALDGQRAISVIVNAPASSPVRAGWELFWSADANGANEQRKALGGDDGVYTASFHPSEIANLARGATIHFRLVETTPTGARTHELGDEPYAFVPDRDTPTATLTAPVSASGANIAVAWSGVDRDSRIASYKVEVRDGSGAWREWIRASADLGGTFSGEPGHSYAFRVTALDAVGHASAPSDPATSTVPSNAPTNRAPIVSFTAPAAGAIVGRTLSAVIVATDPDGTQPVLRVCARKSTANVDLSCLTEGKATTLTLDTSKLADGAYRLHAVATDGSLSAEALSAVFRVDRAPPVFRGAAAEAGAERVVLSASLDDDATRVTVDVAGRTLALAKGANGVWTTETPSLAPGEYALAFRAVDATGNEATLTRSLVVPVPAPAKPAPGTTPPTTPTTAPPTTPTDAAPPADEGGKGVPGAPLAIGLVLLGAVAVAMRRRRG